MNKLEEINAGLEKIKYLLKNTLKILILIILLTKTILLFYARNYILLYKNIMIIVQKINTKLKEIENNKIKTSRDMG